VRALLDAGYKKPDEDMDACDEMAVEPYVDRESDDDDDADTSSLGSSSQPRVPSSSHPRQVFALGRKLAGRKSMEKQPVAKAKQPAKIHGTAIDLFTFLVEKMFQNMRCLSQILCNSHFQLSRSWLILRDVIGAKSLNCWWKGVTPCPEP